MCGIFALYNPTSALPSDAPSDANLIALSNKIAHRGPDLTTHLRVNKNLFFSFHRLAVNGLDSKSNQPFQIGGVYLMSNGEIFNYKKLIEFFHLEEEYKSGSDCEIILHLFLKVGLKETCRLLDGEYAFVLYDSNTDVLCAGRDPLGIRSLYWARGEDGDIWFASELKAFDYSRVLNIQQFGAGKIWSSHMKSEPVDFDGNSRFSMEVEIKDEEEIISRIRDLFTEAVKKRLMSERKIACLLSGGLDSTTVTAIVRKLMDVPLDTFSIGLKGSVDLVYAEMASKAFGTNHTSVELSEEEFLGAIERTIIQIESYDTTTVRASIGNFLISLYVRENTENTVLFCGDVSDEIFASYRGFFYAPDDDALFRENVTMLSNISYFDVLRSDKCIAGAGLEARVPFSDKAFVSYSMSLPANYKRFSKERMEKYYFRKAFEHLLPSELAWRTKTAFSDGVSHEARPWYQIIQDFMNDKYTDAEFIEKSGNYEHNRPYDKESLYYREIYEKHYPRTAHTIPFFWKQPFMKGEDPSAWKAEKEASVKMEE